MKTTRYSYHPACKLFPRLPDNELQDLAEDIRKNGLQNPIVLLNGKILDGRNRLAACKISGVEPRFKEWKGKGSPVEWVISQNMMRRHLTPSQKAVVAHDLLPLLEKEAKERQRKANEYRGNGRLAQKCANRNGKGKASEAAARIIGTNPRYVEMVKQIHLEAPKLVERIRTGEVNITEARRLATISSQRSAEQKARKRSPKQRAWTITGEQKIVKCQAVITDPPYGITNEPWEPDDLEAFTRDWCGRWCKGGADFFAVFWSQERLFDGRVWFDESLRGYRFQQLLVWHAKNNMAHKSRKCLKQTWEPVLLYRRTGSNRNIISSKKTWDTDHHNCDCFVAPVPQTNFNGEDHALRQWASEGKKGGFDLVRVQIDTRIEQRHR
jgi:ParB-like nuclease family protein/DNA methylase